MKCEHHGNFSEIARKHATNPRNYGPIENFDGHARITGPCGDSMEFWISVINEKVAQVSFITDGCGSSRACGSMAVALAEGKHIEDAAALKQKDILDALGKFPKESEHCALLATNTLKAACENYLENACKDSCNESCESCTAENCSSRKQPKENKKENEDREKLRARMSRIQHKILVMSGKGGVGKSTVAVNLAVSLMMSGKQVGLLDTDIHGPSIPTMLGLEGESMIQREEGLIPIDANGLKVLSLGFFLKHTDVAVIWRGPIKIGVIQQFLKDADWGDLDYLIIDAPPGTGDEPLSICQFIENLDGTIIVTTPQKVASVDVRKSVTFCRQLHVPILGIVENMSGFVCPKCGEITPILRTGGGQHIASDMNIPFLGAIPMDPKIAETSDNGRAFIQYYADSPTANAMREIIKPIFNLEKKYENKKH
ncbi:MAG: P-loop NTPase [Verrucomicrobiota bacterium]